MSERLILSCQLLYLRVVLVIWFRRAWHKSAKITISSCVSCNSNLQSYNIIGIISAYYFAQFITYILLALNAASTDAPPTVLLFRLCAFVRAHVLRIDDGCDGASVGVDDDSDTLMRNGKRL